MKAVFVGGGAHRHLGIIRSAMARPGVFDGGEVYLYDLNVPRAELVAQLLRTTPEYRRCGCRIVCGDKLPEALTGADAVTVVLMAGSPRSFRLGDEPSLKYGFISSDNLSMNGAFLAAKGVPIVLGIAREMEKYCPDAVLLDFANPVAVLSAAVNRHTKIQAYGVCGGFTNHLWDLSRFFGRDEEAQNYDGECAGVNHLSFITRGVWEGKDLFTELDRVCDPAVWRDPELQPWWPEGSKANIRRSVRLLRELYLKLGVMVFSSEGDGMAHLRYEEEVAEGRAKLAERKGEDLEATLKAQREARAQADESFAAALKLVEQPGFWEDYWRQDLRFGRVDKDIFVQMLTAIAGVSPVKVAASCPASGAVVGVPDDFICEYTFHLSGKKRLAAGRYTIPAVVAGVTMGMVAHQNLLADALATEDPKLFARALLTYPIKSYSHELAELSKELIEINREEIARPLLRAVDYL